MSKKDFLTSAIQDWMVKNRVRECPVYVRIGGKVTTYIILRDKGDELYAQKPGFLPLRFDELHHSVVKLIHKEFIVED